VLVHPQALWWWSLLLRCSTALPQDSRALLSSPTIVSNEIQFREAVSFSETTLLLSHDMSLSEEVVISNVTGLTIDGQGMTVSGGGLVRCFKTVDAVVTFVNITIADGYGDVGGGVKVSGNSSVWFESSSLLNNAATGNGGGLWVGGGSSTVVVLENSEISESYAAMNGGGMYAEQGASISVTRCRMDHNAAPLGGGALSTQDNALVVFKETTFTRSSSDSLIFGTAINNKGGVVVLGGCSLASLTESVKGKVTVLSTCEVGFYHESFIAARCVSPGWCTDNAEDGRFNVPAELLTGECSACGAGLTTACCGSRSESSCVDPSSPMAVCSAFEESMCKPLPEPPSPATTEPPSPAPTEPPSRSTIPQSASSSPTMKPIPPLSPEKV